MDAGKAPQGRRGIRFAAAAFACYLVGLAAAPSGSRVAELVDNWFYVGLFIVAVVLVGARAVLVADDRLAWSILALALACTGFAEVYYLAATPDSYPSVADAAWLAFYPLAYVGIVLLVRRRARPLAGTLWLDGATAAGDLGKLAVPDEILRKRGPLDEREWEFIRQHTVVGERILRASPALRTSRRSSARATRTGTAAATPTSSSARRFPSPRGSSASATRSPP